MTMTRNERESIAINNPAEGKLQPTKVLSRARWRLIDRKAKGCRAYNDLLARTFDRAVGARSTIPYRVINGER